MDGEVDNRVSNDNVDNDLKMKQNEDWAKVFYGANAIHRIKWNNNGCLIFPRWFSKHYCFENYKYKENHMPKDEVPEGKRKAYRTYLKKICSLCHKLGPSGIRPEWEPPLGTLRHWIHNTR